METEKLKSKDIGYVFRGFRNQTLYSVNRILKDNNYNFQPEGEEDLSIYSKGDLIEVVQVKSYTTALSLSDLKPKKNDSFLRRVINLFKEGHNFKVNLVSFGPIGPQLDNGVTAEGNDRRAIKKKLIDYNYSEEDIKLIFDNINIEIVDEEELTQNIFEYLKETHVGSNPKIAFELLMYWIYQSSEKMEFINNENLVDKLDSIGQFLNERKFFHDEFGKSIIPLKHSQSKVKPKKFLENEFYEGISTRYEHIEKNVDIKRWDRLTEMKEKLEENNILIVHGASGQGKTTLAYRYLHEFYPLAYTYQIKSKERDAFKIVSALNAISKSAAESIAIYVDAEPGDNVWPEIVKQLSYYSSFNILVTIREEDWKRSEISGEDFKFSEIELSLEIDEAKQVFEYFIRKKTDIEFINFEDAWLKFGENGPLLEFTYLIAKGHTLKERLKKQINRIKKEAKEENELERLDLLRIVSLIGMQGGKTDLTKLINEVSLRDNEYIIELFQKEYLLRKGEKGNYIEGLHPIRSQILVELLFDPIINPIGSIIEKCISVILESDLEIFLLNYFVEFGFNDKLFNLLDKHNFSTWTGYSNVIRSLLWLGVKNYVDESQGLIDETYDEFGSGWSLVLNPDLSNAMNKDIPKDLLKLNLLNSESKLKANNFRKRQKNRDLIYKFLKVWLEKSELPPTIPNSENEWDSLSYGLFWLGKLNIDKNINFERFEINNNSKNISLETIGNVIIGFYYNNKINIIDRVNLLDRYRKEYKVPLIEDDGEKITIHSIINIENEFFSSEGDFVHDQIIKKIELIRKIYPDRKVIGSKGYGHEFKFLDQEWDSTIKNIPIENLPLYWLTQINSIFMGLANYQKRPANWSQYVDDIIDIRKQSILVFKLLLRNLNDYYKKKRFVTIWESKSLGDEWIKLIKKIRYNKSFPKTAVDPWGYGSEAQNDINSKYKHITLDLAKFKTFNEAYGNFCISLQNFLDQGSNVIFLQKLCKLAKKSNMDTIKTNLEKSGIKTDVNDLSIFNLYELFLGLKKFQLEFRNHFSNLADSLDKLDEEENHIYELVLGMWRLFALEKYELNRNILNFTETTLRIKKEGVINKTLESLKKEEIKIKLIDKSSIKHKYIFIEISDPIEIDELAKRTFKILQNAFKGIEYLDLEKLFLDFHFPFFRIVFIVNGKLLVPISYNFPLYSILDSNQELNLLNLNPKKIGHDQLTILAIEKWSNSILELKKMEDVYFKISAVSTFAYHLSQLKSLDLDDLGLAITKEYVNTIAKQMQNCLQETLDSFGYILSNFREIIINDADLLHLVQNISDNIFPEEKDDKNNPNFDFVISLGACEEWNEKLIVSMNNIWFFYLIFSKFRIDEYYLRNKFRMFKTI